MTEILSVQNLGKKYKRYPNKRSRIIEWFSSGKKQRHEEIWVLKGLNFTVQQGESIGIIGHNGAGKSTLLKIITGASQASEGKVTINGKIAALLELGMGFHPEFTGRQNAITSCQIMGLKLSQIQQLLAAIIEFSELGDYIDQPLRTYSSGMQMRLAFSVATAVRPDVLIIDEALSVGDAYFSHKSIARIRRFKEQGTTLFFVSHDPGAVKSLCERAILLDKGMLIKQGAADTVLDYYNAIIVKKEKDNEIRLSENKAGKSQIRSGNKKATIVSVEMNDTTDTPCRAFCIGDETVLKIQVQYNEPIQDASVGILIRDRLGNDIYGTNTWHYDISLPEKIGVISVNYNIVLNLGLGHYSISVASHAHDTHVLDNHDWWDNVIAFQMIPNDGYTFIGVAALPTKISYSLIDN